MVNKDDIIKDILLEISYRSDEGYPNFSKPAHISILSEVLTEMGLTDVKYELIKNSLEEDKDETFTAKSKESGKVVPFKSKEARDAAIEAGTHEKTDKKRGEITGCDLSVDDKISAECNYGGSGRSSNNFYNRVRV